MSDTLKRHAISGIQTFGVSFIMALSIQLSNGAISWTTDFWFAVVTVALRAAIKAVVEASMGATGDPEPIVGKEQEY